MFKKQHSEFGWSRVLPQWEKPNKAALLTLVEKLAIVSSNVRRFLQTRCWTKLTSGPSVIPYRVLIQNMDEMADSPAISPKHSPLLPKYSRQRAGWITKRLLKR